MQIFYTDSCPVKAAHNLCDMHVGCGRTDNPGRGGKQIIESAQMLANAYPLNILDKPYCPKTKKGTSRVHSYLHHPCSKWVLESLENWYWLLEHAKELVREKIYRGGSLHFTSVFIDWCQNNMPDLPSLTRTQPVQAIDKFCQESDPVAGYRNYYLKVKKFQFDCVWTNRKPPEWWNV